MDSRRQRPGRKQGDGTVWGRSQASPSGGDLDGTPALSTPTSTSLHYNENPDAGRDSRLPAIEFRGRRKLALIRDLAMGEHAYSTLARMYDATEDDILTFASANGSEIQEVSQALSGTLNVDTAGIWAARKQNRLAELQQAIEDINEVVDGLRAQGVRWSRSHRDMFRARLDLYRQIAEELGAYPQRQSPPVRTGVGVTYVIEAQDTEALQ